MPFWSGQKLRTRLSSLVDKPDPGCIDCAAYTLKVGSEYFVTPSDQVSNPHQTTLKTLNAGESFAIPAGQFAYVLTEEIVTIPTSAIAFISIRTKIKWRGLVNVSGFHVDPGFCGKLLFAVYNAGPSSITLRRQDAVFLIWFADLDKDCPQDSKHGMKPVTQIDTGAINHVAGVIYSVQGLAEKIRESEKDLGARITSLERANGVVIVCASVLLTALVGLAGQWLVKTLNREPSSTAQAAQTEPVEDESRSLRAVKEANASAPTLDRSVVCSSKEPEKNSARENANPPGSTEKQ